MAGFMQSRLGEHLAATVHAVCSGVTACRACNWNAAECRFYAIAAGERPFWPEHLPRLQLESRRWPVSCNRGWRIASFGPNACRVCSWNAAERRFHAIAAGEMPLSARVLAAACCVLRCNCLLHCASPIVHPLSYARPSPYALPRTPLSARVLAAYTPFNP